MGIALNLIRMRKKTLFLFALGLLVLFSCKEEEMPPIVSVFKVVNLTSESVDFSITADCESPGDKTISPTDSMYLSSTCPGNADANALIGNLTLTVPKTGSSNADVYQYEYIYGDTTRLEIERGN